MGPLPYATRTDPCNKVHQKPFTPAIQAASSTPDPDKSLPNFPSRLGDLLR